MLQRLCVWVTLDMNCKWWQIESTEYQSRLILCNCKSIVTKVWVSVMWNKIQ